MHHAEELVENQRYWGLSWGSPLLPFDWPPWSDPSGLPSILPSFPTMDGEGGWYAVRNASTDDEGWRYGTMFTRLTHPRPGGRASKRGSDQVRSRRWRRIAHVQKDVLPLLTDAAVRFHRAQLLTTSATFPSAGRSLTTEQFINQAAGSANSLGGGGGGEGSGGGLAGGANNGLPVSAGQQASPAPPSASALGSAVGALTSVFDPAKPTVLKLLQALFELWNDSCARHGMRQVLPLDPVGLFLASKEHGRNLDASRRAQLHHHKVLAAAPCLPVGPPPTTAPLPSVPPPGGTPATATPDNATPVPSVSMAVEGVPVPVVSSPSLPERWHEDRFTSHGGSSGTARITTTSRLPSHPPVSVCGHGMTGRPMRRVSSGAGLAAAAAAATAVATGPIAGSDAVLDHKHGGRQNGRAGQSHTPGMWPGSHVPLPHQVHDHPYRMTGTPEEKHYLLAEMVSATNYARAAYGYVMTAGYLTSFSKLIGMASMSAYFDPVKGASVEANNEAIHCLTGVPPEDILMCEWRSTIFRPCHYLLVDRARRQLVLSVRGSLEMSDITTDLTAAPLEIRFGELQGHVHQGLMSAATFVHFNISSALQKGVEQHPGWPLLVTGHSLGGGVAGLLGLLLRQPGGAPAGIGPVRCVCIASAAVMDSVLADSCREHCLSLVHNADFVPRLSFFSVERALIDLVRLSPAHQMTNSLIQSTTETWNAISAGLARVRAVSGILGQDDDTVGVEEEFQQQVEVEMARQQRRTSDGPGGVSTSRRVTPAAGDGASTARGGGGWGDASFGESAITWQSFKSSLMTSWFGDEVSDDSSSSSCSSYRTALDGGGTASESEASTPTGGVGTHRHHSWGSGGTVGGTVGGTSSRAGGTLSRTTTTLHSDSGSGVYEDASGDVMDSATSGAQRSADAHTDGGSVTSPCGATAGRTVTCSSAGSTGFGGVLNVHPNGEITAAVPPECLPQTSPHHHHHHHNHHHHHQNINALQAHDSAGSGGGAAAASSGGAAADSGGGGGDLVAAREAVERAADNTPFPPAAATAVPPTGGRDNDGRWDGGGPPWDQPPPLHHRQRTPAEEAVVEQAAELAASMPRGPKELYPPGRILWIVYADEDAVDGDADAAAGRRRPAADVAEVGPGAAGVECGASIGVGDGNLQPDCTKPASAAVCGVGDGAGVLQGEEAATQAAEAFPCRPSDPGDDEDAGLLPVALVQDFVVVGSCSDGPTAPATAAAARQRLGAPGGDGACAAPSAQLAGRGGGGGDGERGGDDADNRAGEKADGDGGSGGGGNDDDDGSDDDEAYPLRSLIPCGALDSALAGVRGRAAGIAASFTSSATWTLARQALPEGLSAIASYSGASGGNALRQSLSATLGQREAAAGGAGGTAVGALNVEQDGGGSPERSTNFAQKFTDSLRKIKDSVLSRAALLGSSEGGAGDGTGRRCIYLLDADKECFQCLVLVPSCVSEHIPDVYYRALNQLVAGLDQLPDLEASGDGPHTLEGLT